MHTGTMNKLALAIAATLGAAAMSASAHDNSNSGPGNPDPAKVVGGKYVAGDFHNHTTCSDGAISMQKLVSKATGKTDGTFGLDWFVQAGHGGNGNRNCTLAEDATLGTPAYPYVAGKLPTNTWEASGVT